jgi:hypothetical protein
LIKAKESKIIKGKIQPREHSLVKLILFNLIKRINFDSINKIKSKSDHRFSIQKSVFFHTRVKPANDGVELEEKPEEEDVKPPMFEFEDDVKPPFPLKFC